VIGGSKEYTGAPYYAGVSSLKAGGDITHIICPEEASIPIKSYSPELIVHPCLNDIEETEKWMDACNSVVIGPGLGRDENLGNILYKVLKKVEENEKLRLVGDADFLWFLSLSSHKHVLVE
jgi:ATP-dependent NAD(P)H-hydrate dehydratase